jgi:hypothetical protein
MLAFMFLPAISGDSRCSALVPLTNTVLLLGTTMLPTWRWVKISIYLHLEPFHLIAYMLLVLNRILLLSSSLLLCSSFLFNSDLHYYYYYYYVLLQFVIHTMLCLSIMYLCISALCCVCNWPCRFWLST